LREVNVTVDGVTSAVFACLVGSGSRLESLAITFDDDNTVDFTPLAKCTNLTAIAVWSAPISATRLLDAVPRVDCITKLTVASTLTACVVSAIARMRTVETLDISAAHKDETHLRSIVTACPRLTALSLSRSMDAEALIVVPPLAPRLTSLKCSDAILCDAKCTAAFAEGCRHLTRLDIHGLQSRPPADASWQIIADRMLQLKSLHLLPHHHIKMPPYICDRFLVGGDDDWHKLDQDNGGTSPW
jgi:hypothetical protein